jgi:hypothetical protein
MAANKTTKAGQREFTASCACCSGKRTRQGPAQPEPSGNVGSRREMAVKRPFTRSRTASSRGGYSGVEEEADEEYQT